MKNTNKQASLILGVLLMAIVCCSILVSINTKPIFAAAPADSSVKEYTLLEPLPSISSGSAEPQKTVNLTTYIKDAINLLIALSAVAAVFMIVWGGLQYMTTDSWGGKKDGLKKASDALIGLLMILSTYIILQAVNPAMLKIAKIEDISNTLKTSSANNLMNNVNSSNAAIDRLLAEADRLNSQAGAQEARDRIATLQDELSGAQTEYEDSCMGVDWEDRDLQDYCNSLTRDISTIKNDISSTTAGVAITIQKGISGVIVSRAIVNMSSATDPAVIERESRAAVDENASSTAIRAKDLQDIGAVEQAATLQSQSKYSEASTYIAAEIAKVNAVNNQRDATGWGARTLSAVFSNYKTSDWQNRLDIEKSYANSATNDILSAYKSKLSASDYKLLEQKVKDAQSTINGTKLH
ncbi:MAG: pilin [Candidatus Taylorbacteria bacterium]